MPFSLQRYFEHTTPIRISRPARSQPIDPDFEPMPSSADGADDANGAGASGVAPADKPLWQADDDSENEQAHLTGYEKIQKTIKAYRGNGKAPASSLADDDEGDD